MRKIITKITAYGLIIAMAAIALIPQISSAQTVTSIPDNTILISVTSPTSARITWYTNVPTTSTLWYSDIPLSAMTPVQYLNSSEGYSMSHSVILTGIDLVRQHTFRVGGSTQAGVMITSGDQVI